MRGASCVTHGAWDRQRVALFVGPDMAGFRIERQALHSVVTVAVHSGQSVELRFGRAAPNRLAGVSIRKSPKNS